MDFWSLMSGGSWLGTGKDSIGDLPGDMSAWDKLQLGWLNYGKAKAAKQSTHKLGVAEYNTKNKQAVVVELLYQGGQDRDRAARGRLQAVVERYGRRPEEHHVPAGGPHR